MVTTVFFFKVLGFVQDFAELKHALKEVYNVRGTAGV